MEDHKLNWVEMYGPIFIDHLNISATFTSHLHFMSIEQQEKFSSRPRSNKVVSEWLTELEPIQHREGIFKAVVEALENSEQTHIAEMLENRMTVPSKLIVRNKSLIRVFSPALVKVSPVEMLPYLPCLSDEEREEIETYKDQHSNQQTAMKMLSYLVLKGEEMYGQVMNALNKTKYDTLAKDLSEMVESESSSDMSNGDSESRKDVKPFRKEVDSGDSLNNMAVATSENRSSHPTDSLNVDIEHVESKQSTDQGEHCEQESPADADNADLLSPPPTEKLELRRYQDELAHPALPGYDGGKGKNTVVVAPTGSGKTIVAVKVAMEFLNYKESIEGASVEVLKSLPRKVIFLVNQVALVEQQSKLFQKYLGSKSVIGLSGETAHGPLKPIIEAKAVLVMTAQILVNALQDHTAELTDIGLLILDECHNCQKNTPYNKIMAGYRDMKLSAKQPRPQILGMTASLDIAQAKSEYQAEGKILQLCANLDAEVISTVHTKECLEELALKQNIPTEDIIEVAGRSRDPFAEKINVIMENIEKLVDCTADWEKLLAYNPQLKIPTSRGTQTYEQWVVRMQDGIAVTVTDKAKRRKLMACTDHLKVYNDSLYINRDIRTIDALCQLEEFMEVSIKHVDDWNKLTPAERETKDNPLDETDEFLLKQFNDRRTELTAISTDPNNRNPVLEKLGDVLRKAFEITDEVQEKRGILFTKTRASTEALLNWIEQTKELAFLKPGRLIGSGGSGGMTQHQQVDLLELFREGGHNIIVATSVAQEGLDIAKCNVVVRYNYISSVVAHVQARGRNRAKGGQFFLVVDEQLKLKDKDLMNRIREQMMLQATKTIQKRLISEKEDFLAKITKLQRDDQVERKLSAVKDATKTKNRVKKPVKLTCRKCGEFACPSSEIRSIKDAHHIVISDEFQELYDTKDNARFPMIVDDFDFQKTIVCKKCKSEWGTLGMYKGMTLPLLRIAGFIVEYPNGKQQRTKKWKDVLFKVEPITPEDLEKIVNIDENLNEADDGDDNEKANEV